VLSCEFTYADGSRPHAVWAMIDMAWHGAPTTLVLADDPAESRRSIEKDARRRGATPMRRLAVSSLVSASFACLMRAALRYRSCMR
jgi:hypothetical protein